MFEIIDRGKSEFLVLAAGWGFDCRVFGGLELGYNYIVCGGLCGDGFERQLKDFLAKKGIAKVSLLGWSHGAFEVCRFAENNTEMIGEIILVSMRKRYENAVIEKIKGYIRKNKRAFLYSFYKDCFSETEEKEYEWFKSNLMKDYISSFTEDDLIGGLERLCALSISGEMLSGLGNVTIFHGSDDRIAPAKEAEEIAAANEHAKLIVIEGAGHLPFLRKEFAGYFNE